MKKRIGIPGWKTGDNSFGVTVPYLEFVKQFGDPVIIMPHEEIADVDALLLPGGPDLPPSSYGQLPSFYTSNQDVFKQYFFTNRLPEYIGKMPIFGICLGFQMLNVAFGGSIQQHLAYHKTSSERWETAHEVEVINLPGWERKEKDKPRTTRVNSLHHQGVLESMLADTLTPVAIAESGFRDKLIEAFIHTEFPIAAVQWHPEELNDLLSRQLFKRILK